MSRLDSFIRRMEAQRECLNRAIALVADLDGPAFELGLGNGRTFDHLRAAMPKREIFVFDRQVAAHPECIPDDDHLLLGDISATLPKAAERFSGQVVLAHCDVGTGNQATNREIAATIAPLLAKALAPGGTVIADQALASPALGAIDLPDGVAPGRYFMYRRKET